ncbi:unnamed protein product, partial [Porites evermanni]
KACIASKDLIETGPERVQLSTYTRLLEPPDSFVAFLTCSTQSRHNDASTILTINEATDSEYVSQSYCRIYIMCTWCKSWAEDCGEPFGQHKIWPFVPKWGGQCGGR